MIVSVGVSVEVYEGVGVNVSVDNTGNVIWLARKVTSAFRASARPSKTAPVLNLIASRANTVPLKSVVVPKVQFVPTCQKTFADCAPPVKTTLLPSAVVRVLPIRMMKTAFGSPRASRVTAPVNPSELDSL